MTHVWTRCQFIWLSPDIHDTYGSREWCRYSFEHIKSNPNKTIGTLVAVAWFLEVYILYAVVCFIATPKPNMHSLAIAGSVFILESICVLVNKEHATERLKLREDSGSENKLQYRNSCPCKQERTRRRVGYFAVGVGVFELKFVAFMIGYSPHTSCWKCRQTWCHTFFRIRRQLKINRRKKCMEIEKVSDGLMKETASRVYANNALGILWIGCIHTLRWREMKNVFYEKLIFKWESNFRRISDVYLFHDIASIRVYDAL